MTPVCLHWGLFTQKDCLKMWTRFGWLWCHFYIAKLSLPWPWGVRTKAKQSWKSWVGIFYVNEPVKRFAWHCPACRVDNRHFRGAISFFLTFSLFSKAKLVLLFIFSIQRSFKTPPTLCVNHLFAFAFIVSAYEFSEKKSVKYSQEACFFHVWNKFNK